MTGAWSGAEAAEAEEMDWFESCLACQIGTTWCGFTGEAGDGPMSTKEDSYMSGVGNRMAVVLYPDLGLTRRQPSSGNQDEEFSFRHVAFEDTARHLKGSYPGGN